MTFSQFAKYWREDQRTRRAGRDAEQDYLDVLSDQVQRYEATKHPARPLSDAAMLRHLIEAKGVTQAAVSKATGIVNSTISEVLRGRRMLSRRHIGRLARYFNVPPTVFAALDKK